MSDLVSGGSSEHASLDLMAGMDLVEVGLPSAALHLDGVVMRRGHARSPIILVERCERFEEDALSTLVARIKLATQRGERP